ncbi:AMMECR1 domain-containing protein [Lipomyces chichibuensis]|uniref:AMMECR1 domain-containing protein n=1 Tax=Lipomyces chichibuensis TaxID=1546026 RepID=UPI0033438289
MASKAQCAFCFDVLVAHFEDRSTLPLSWFENSDSAAISELTSSSSSSVSSVDTVSFVKVTSANHKSHSSYPLFVTWNVVVRGQPRLRGCIGTFEPQPLERGLRTYARTASVAFDDTRFNPILAKELPSLECGVSLLMDFEEASGPLDWEWGVHGIRISFIVSGRRYSATYLPDVPPEHFESKEQTVESLVHKAGYIGASWPTLSIKLVRYKSSKTSLSYAEYVAIMKRV